MPKKELSDVEMHLLEKNGQAKPVMSDEEMMAASQEPKQKGLLDKLQISEHIPAYKDFLGSVDASNEESLKHLAEMGMPLSQEDLEMSMSMGAAGATGSPLGGFKPSAGGKALQKIANTQAVKAFSPAARDFEQLVESGAGSEALKAGMGAFDSSPTLYKKLDSAVRTIGEKEIQPAISGSKATVSTEKMMQEFAEPKAIETGEAAADRIKAFDEVKSQLAKQKGELSPEDLYELKKQYDAQAGYKSRGGVSSASDKMLADKMRSSLKEAVPEVQEPLARQQNLIRLREEVAGESSSAGRIPKTSKDALIKTVGAHGNQLLAVSADKASKLLDHPVAQRLGSYLPMLLGARERGPEAFNATIHVLNQDPEFRKKLEALHIQ